MPINRDYATKIIAGIPSELQTRFFASLDVMGRLHDDNDWSFVIKVQAIVEAAVTEAVIAKVGEPAILSIVERLPLADEEIGKLTLAKELNILPKEQRRFVRKMAELRNRLAHRVQDIEFDFSKYVESLNSSQLRDWKESVAWFAIERDNHEFWLQRAQEKPRLTVYLSIVLLLGMLDIAQVEAETPRKINAAALRTVSELLASLPEEPSDS